MKALLVIVGILLFFIVGYLFIFGLATIFIAPIVLNSADNMELYIAGGKSLLFGIIILGSYILACKEVFKKKI